MDPNAALAEFRDAMQRARDAGENAHENDTSADYDELQDAVAAAEALDKWMSAGGFLPEAWRVNRARSAVLPTDDGADYACAECGTTTATTYVVTTLDPERASTRTEVCRVCDDALRAGDPS